ncbi:hypothetical protein U746_0405 [Mycolicibacterium mucogenicum 261Sha1.1M5]|nr:hypothetical protein U746_0405 [Mycolicibacterium mucogenicum 261Sha1.1M5]
MTMFNANRFRRVFRFHPRAWRELHLEAATGTLIDAAEAAGRPYPSARDRASVYGHAASVWAARVVRPETRDVVASLALGTGIGLSAVFLSSALLGGWLGSSRNNTFGALDMPSTITPLLPSALLLSAWLAAGVVFAGFGARAARWPLGVALFGGAALLVAKLVLPMSQFAAGTTVVMLGAFGLTALSGTLRSRVVWLAAVVTAALGAVRACWPVLMDEGNLHTESHLWRVSGPWILAGVVGLCVALAISAAAGNRALSSGGILYSTLWLAAALAAYSRDGHNALTIGTIAVLWAAGAAGIWVLARRPNPQTQHNVQVTPADCR